jgi:protocatechuate 3,4-dioxygenase beta subunit
MPHDSLSRRELLALGVAAASASVIPRPLARLLQQQELPRTEDQVLGPFYPIQKPLDRDADLTRVRGRRGVAQGQVIHLGGRVVDVHGKPLPGIKVEIWQANARGRYSHTNDTNPAPLDPNFQGYGVQVTDKNGLYRFKTIKPGAYPTGIGDWMRPPHVHFDVTGRHEALVTQMYFPGDPLNGKDQLLQSAAPNQPTLVAKIDTSKDAADPGALLVSWDIVLLKG